jgi:uncharacterized protein YciI
MYILITSYSQPPEIVNRYFKSHCEWLNKYIKAGIFLASGPKKSHLGGAIIVKSIDKDKLKSIIEEDSYVIADVADYLIVDMDCKLAAVGFEKLIGV